MIDEEGEQLGVMDTRDAIQRAREEGKDLVEVAPNAKPPVCRIVQITVLPITDRINDYAERIAKNLKEAGFRVETNLKSDKIGAKIRDAQINKVPFMIVLGDKELEENKIAVRERTRGDLGAMPLEEFIEMARRLKETRAIVNA